MHPVTRRQTYTFKNIMRDILLYATCSLMPRTLPGASVRYMLIPGDCKDAYIYIYIYIPPWALYTHLPHPISHTKPCDQWWVMRVFFFIVFQHRSDLINLPPPQDRRKHCRGYIVRGGAMSALGNVKTILMV